MAAKVTTTISFGSGKYARLRKEAYLKAAETREGGNLSRLIISLVDEALGLELPMTRQIGRPTKNQK
jgi:hypothetical protein